MLAMPRLEDGTLDMQRPFCRLSKQVAEAVMDAEAEMYATGTSARKDCFGYGVSKSCLIEETVGKIQAAFSLHVLRLGSVLAIFEDLFALVMRGYIFQR